VLRPFGVVMILSSRSAPRAGCLVVGCFTQLLLRFRPLYWAESRCSLGLFVPGTSCDCLRREPVACVGERRSSFLDGGFYGATAQSLFVYYKRLQYAACASKKLIKKRVHCHAGFPIPTSRSSFNTSLQFRGRIENPLALASRNLLVVLRARRQ